MHAAPAYIAETAPARVRGLLIRSGDFSDQATRSSCITAEALHAPTDSLPGFAAF